MVNFQCSLIGGNDIYDLFQDPIQNLLQIMCDLNISCIPNIPVEDKTWREQETSLTLPAFPTPGAAWAPSAASYPEPFVSQDVPRARVTDPWLWDRTSPYVKLDAGNVSIANL